jgi:cytoskeletal protein CcmA (bactofilin family)
MFNKKKQPPIRSLIADGTHIEGNLRFTGGLRIDGVVLGDIRSNPEQPSLLVISETASVTGEIHVDHVIINGTVTGPVYAKGMLELQPKTRIMGDVHYTALEMHQGAIISGQMRPLSEAAAEAKPTLVLAANR